RFSIAPAPMMCSRLWRCIIEQGNTVNSLNLNVNYIFYSVIFFIFLTLGGDGEIVEIDESLFVRFKHHKGKDLKRKQVWVFGLYEGSSRRCLFFVVDKRDAVNLLNVIYKHVDPKTIIHRDCRKAYQRISKLDKNYTHLTVNHDLFFVDPTTGVHTNEIESIWCSAKSLFKKIRGYNKTLVNEGSFTCNGLLESLKQIENDEDFELEYNDEENVDMSLPVGDIDDFVFTYDKVKSVFESNDCDSIQCWVKPLSEKNEKDFQKAITEIISLILNGSIISYRFQSDLSTAQREIIHQLCTDRNLTHVTSGTRYRVITICKEEMLQTNKVANKLTDLANENVVQNAHVMEVINSNKCVEEKRKRGRPPKVKN
ncbi:transposase, partial [Brachionus plicatilis]